jgi:2-polyprenyl-3-methyl-5-hydroxy-6-metoxy-1,4-benzoquinol methylase
MKNLLRLGRKRFFMEAPIICAAKVFGPKGVAKVLLKIVYILEQSVDYLAICNSENGNHPKHRLTDYHKFFNERISGREIVLDIGCGNGCVAIDIAKQTGAHVIGIDKDCGAIRQAKNNAGDTQIEFHCGDILNMELPRADVVVLSNVLEHIKNRIGFLRSIRENLRPKKLLLRVPQYERHWLIPYAQELGLNTKLDPTHYIEHRQEEILSELKDSGWETNLIEARWGEYRIEAIPGKRI